MADVKCKGCDEIIDGGRPAATMVGTDAYHPHCMKCDECGKDIVGPYSTSSDGKMMHLDCREAKTCAGCKGKIEGQFVTASSEEFHPDCFKCATCQKAITGSFRTDKETGKRICQGCVVRKTCTACHKVLEGQFMTALGGTYHPACFTCSSCSAELSGSFFQTESGQVVCEACLEESGDPSHSAHCCQKCKKMIVKGTVLFGHNDEPFHEACFKCSQCATPLDSFVIDQWNESSGPDVNYLCVPCGNKERLKYRPKRPIKTTDRSTSFVPDGVKDDPNNPPQVTQGSADTTDQTAIDHTRDTVKPKNGCDENAGSKESHPIVPNAALEKIPRSPVAELPVLNENVSEDPPVQIKSSIDIKEQTTAKQTHAVAEPKYDGRTFPIENLRDHEFCKENGIDVKNKEYYLSDDQFDSLIGVPRDAWEKQPAWKKTVKKKALRIF